MLNPRTIAVIGASETEKSVGRRVIENLRSFDGTVYPINLKRATVFGSKAYGKIGDVPSPVDLAVITTRAATAPNLVSECAAAGVKGAVILSAGFRESGVEGIRLEQEIMTRRGEVRIIGPNSLGIMIPDLNLNATFARKLALKGNVAFISQSGALCTSVLDWSIRQKVGFSLFLSTGSMLDVGWRDLIDYLANDFHTSSILIYMESLGDARSFLSAAREMALRKPIIVIKAGRTEAAARAVVSHTGALTGDDTVIDSAFRRVGVLRVKTIEDLFCMAEVLSKQPRPKGPRLAIVTNAGGPGVLATDVLVAEGGEVAQLSSESVKELDAVLPDGWSRQNPVNLLRDADADRYTNAFEVLTGDSNVDGVLAIVTPQVTTDPTAIAKALATFKNVSEKPILACWMGAADVAEGEVVLNASGIPTFQFPDAATRTFCYMWRYSDNLRALYETPGRSGNWSDDLSRSHAKRIIEEVHKSGRTLLTEVESKEVLAAYGIPVVETLVACSEEQSVQAAKELGTTVVLKLYSETITHKTDAGGVKLNLQNETDVRLAYRQIQQALRDKSQAFLGVTVEPMVRSGYELMFGSRVDPQFGPILSFGTGGQLVEFMRDYAFGLPPLNATLARRLMERTRIYKALQRTNVDLTQLERMLVEFSLLVAEHPWIKEIDVNPLVISAGQTVALDARIILHESATAEEELPRLAIRPYPQQYVSSWNSKDGIPLTLRPIRPEDEPLMVNFHSQLSEETVYFRYFGLPRLQQRVEHKRLTRTCFNDYDREIALVAVRYDGATKEDEIVGVGRLTKVHGLNQAEFAIVISDQFQRRGLGTKLLSRLVEIGRHERIECIFGYILPENHPMQDVAKKCGFQVDYDRFNYAMRAELRLGA